MRALLAALGAVLTLAWALAPEAAVAGSQTLLGVGKASVAGGGGGAAPIFSWQTNGLASASTTSVTTASSGNTINSGDLLIATLGITDSTSTPHTLVCPTGFTAVGWAPNYDSGFNSGWNSTVCWKIAGAGETGSYQFTWTTNTTQGGVWSLQRFTGANATTPIEASAVQNSGSTADVNPFVAPAATSGGANRLAILYAMAFKSTQTFTCPTGNGYTAMFSTTGSGRRMAACSQTVGSGSTGSQNITLGSTDSGAGITILIQP